MTLRSLILSAVAISSSAVITAPAHATSFVFPLSAATQTSNSSQNDGNGRIFTAVTGTEQINVRVSGWSYNGTKVLDSYVGLFSAGLGVTSGDDNGGAGGQHTIDNEGRWDFLIFQFDSLVQLDTAKFAPFNISGKNSRDTDATIAFGTSSVPWTQQLALNNTSISSLESIFTSGFFDSTGDKIINSRSIYDGTAYSNIWLIGAAKSNHDRPFDSFKLSNLSVTTPAVPEPSTWALMMLGLGLIGFSMRRGTQIKPRPHIRALFRT